VTSAATGPGAPVRPPAPPAPRPTVPVTLDGREVLAHDGESVLSLARREGIPIPTLCYLDGLSVHGGCRLCVVEVEGDHRLQPACATVVQDEMEVRTTTPTIADHRRRITALLFSEGAHVCAACVASGHCELQDLATEVGMDHPTYGLGTGEHAVDASHPRFVLDRDRCVLCTRCVRVCDELEGAHVWDIALRGEHARLVAGADQPWGEVPECTSCGKCVAVCPTGALSAQGVASGEQVGDPELVAFLTRARAGTYVTRDEAAGAGPAGRAKETGS
jgi:bidirectional [NiFe] hydrogenase diaphorase subunit